MKKAVVTGANGFVGSALVLELLKNNVEVIAVDIEGCNNRIPSEARFVPVKSGDFSYLTSAVADRDIDAFYHIGWKGSAGNLRGDYSCQLENIDTACVAVKVAKEFNCKKFIFASSIMEYEIYKFMQTDLKPSISSMYSIAKISADYMCRTLANYLEIDYISAVISNIYGPGENSPRLINTSLRKMLNGERVSFSPGEQLYDFIYITDAVKIFALLGDKGKKNKTYYIGNRQPRKLKEFLIEMHSVANPESEIGLGDLPFNGVSLQYDEFNSSAVYEDTDFEPEVSFVQGIKNTIEYIKKEDK